MFPQHNHKWFALSPSDRIGTIYECAICLETKKISTKLCNCKQESYKYYIENYCSYCNLRIYDEE